MPVRSIVIGQQVTDAKRHAAINLRRAMTPTEALLWRELRTNRLGGLHFRRQQIIHGFMVDFYCHAAGLVVEIDGSVHDTQQEWDTNREQVLTELGLQVIRFTNDEVTTDLQSVLQRILLAVQTRTACPRPQSQ